MLDASPPARSSTEILLRALAHPPPAHVRVADAALLGERLLGDGTQVPAGIRLRPADTFEHREQAGVGPPQQPQTRRRTQLPTGVERALSYMSAPDILGSPEFGRLSAGLQRRVREILPGLDRGGQWTLMEALASDVFELSADARLRGLILDAVGTHRVGHAVQFPGFAALEKDEQREVLQGLIRVVKRASEARRLSIQTYLGVLGSRDERLSELDPRDQADMLRAISRGDLSRVPLWESPDGLDRVRLASRMERDASGDLTGVVGRLRIPFYPEREPLPRGYEWPSFEVIADALAAYPEPMVALVRRVVFSDRVAGFQTDDGKVQRERETAMSMSDDGILTVHPRYVSSLGPLLTAGQREDIIRGRARDDVVRTTRTIGHELMHVMTLQAWGADYERVLTRARVLPRPVSHRSRAVPQPADAPEERFRLEVDGHPVDARLARTVDRRGKRAQQLARVLARLPAGSRRQLDRVTVTRGTALISSWVVLQSAPGVTQRLELRIGVSGPPLSDAELLEAIVTAWLRGRKDSPKPGAGSWEEWDDADFADAIAAGEYGRVTRAEASGRALEWYLASLGTPRERLLRDDAMKHRFVLIEKLLRFYGVDLAELRAGALNR